MVVGSVDILGYTPQSDDDLSVVRFIGTCQIPPPAGTSRQPRQEETAPAMLFPPARALAGEVDLDQAGRKNSIISRFQHPDTSRSPHGPAVVAVDGAMTAASWTENKTAGSERTRPRFDTVLERCRFDCCASTQDDANQPLLTMYTMKEQLWAFWVLFSRKDASSILYT